MDRSSPLEGAFGASEKGLVCTLTLELGAEGLLFGRLQLGELALELRGSLSRRTGVGYGFVLEPTSALPLALWRAVISGDKLGLELDVPEPGGFGAGGEALRLALTRLGGWAEA